jgi:hypothetical protein
MNPAMRRDVLVYLSGPMTAKDGHTIESNVAIGVEALVACLKAGVPAFCPHLSGGFPSCWQLIDWETWIAYDLAVIDRCTAMIMLPRWQTSQGACVEREYALSLGMMVFDSLDAYLEFLERRDTLGGQ